MEKLEIGKFRNLPVRNASAAEREFKQVYIYE